MNHLLEGMRSEVKSLAFAKIVCIFVSKFGKIDMKKLILLGLLALCAWQLPAFAAGPDDKAQRILKASEDKLNGLKDFQANFSMVITNPSIKQAPPAQKGTLKFQQDKYAVTLGTTEVYCNLKKVEEFNVTANELTILPYDPEAGVNFESIGNIYRFKSKSRYVSDKATVHGNRCHQIEVAITDPKLDYYRAVVFINQQTNLPEKVTLTDRRQTDTTYEFSNFKLNPNFPPSTFELNRAAHPGLRVYDER